MTERKSYSSGKFHLELPYLLEVQQASFQNFLQNGLGRVFRDVFPISDIKDLYTLRYEGHSIGMPKYSIKECRERGLTYSKPLKSRLKLQIKEDDGENKKLKEEIENEVFICELPMMTENGTFIINGAERVVVSQLHRSPGVSFDEEFDAASGKSVFKSRIIPYRGSWAEFNTDNDVLNLIIDRKKKIPATLLLRVIGYTRTEEILGLFYTPEVVQVSADNIEAYVGRVIFSDVIDTATGEVVAEANMVIGALVDKDKKETKAERDAKNRADIVSVNRLIEAGVTELTLIADSIEDHPLVHHTLVQERKELKPLLRDALRDEAASPNEKKDPRDRRTITSIEEAALVRIYQVMHQNQEDPPNQATARAYFESLFLSDPRKYDLGEVGRYRLNAKIYAPKGIRARMVAPSTLDASAWVVPPKLDTMTMTRSDFLAIFMYMVGLFDGESDFQLDDIDHLGNRRARSIGELLATQLSTGLSRMSRAIRDNLLNTENENLTPQDLVNVRTVNSVVASFFGSSQLSQFMDQTNPLSELTHKRRMSALGPGGLTRERAGFEVRDVHHTHYGRLCPIETPEGPNIGLINSLATYSVINHFGFIETPYRIVGLVEFKDANGNDCLFPEDRWHFGLFKGFVRTPAMFIKDELTAKEMDKVMFNLDKTQRELFLATCNKVFEVKTPEGAQFVRNGKILDSFKGAPDYKQVGEKVIMKISPFVTFLTADEEDKYKVAPASSNLNEDGSFADAFILVRNCGEFPNLVNISEIPLKGIREVERVDLLDVAPMQIVSVAAGLIPFLEHDDANRALMGSNMQRQAVPLLRSDAPIIGTGLEGRAALDSGTVIRAKRSGVVTFVDANLVRVRRDKGQDEEADFLGISDEDMYELRKFERSNQDTCINQKPIVDVGDRVATGDVLADGASTQNGELALGKNILVGFIPWNGYNYEDAIIISEELAIKDTFTSIHIEEYEVEVRETKRGSEELTREIPNVAEEGLVNLDDNGIIRVGAEVEAGDILVGKVTPKGETELSPEERLLLAIFGEKASDVRDTSLKVPPGVRGVVVETRVFSRKERDKKAKDKDREKIESIRREFNTDILNLTRARNNKLEELLVGETSGDVRNAVTQELVMVSGRKITKAMLDKIDFTEVSMQSEFSKNAEINASVLHVLDIANTRIQGEAQRMEKEVDKVTRGDELKPGVLQMVKVYIAKRRRLSIGDKMAGRHGNKGVVSKIVPVEDMPFNEDGKPLQILLNPLGVPSRMNVGQVLEVHLGWAAKALGFKVATPVFDGATLQQIQNELEAAKLGSVDETGKRTGKTKLYDGRSGEPFLNDVTTGYMYVLKLGHLVDDKIHARSIGPYSLVTQQPLGGKSQFGGQRFGEMEVWALEAYGAAYTLQELLTVKSDDVVGRSNVYDAIVKGANTPEPGIPESFRVLIREIRALGLNIKTTGED
jgi:DNA-directed RNA polymerase subunit beta